MPPELTKLPEPEGVQRFHRRQLAVRLGSREMEVTTVSRLYPSAANDGRIDQLLMTTDDPDAAGWLLGRLSDLG